MIQIAEFLPPTLGPLWRLARQADADYRGHEAFFIVAPANLPGEEAPALKQRCYPDVEWRGPMGGPAGFYDCAKAARLLGWSHDG